MKVLIAPDKFKGSLTAQQVCEAVEQGLLQFDKNLSVKKIPMADGGEGSMKLMGQYLDFETVTLPVQDPLGRPLMASYKLLKHAAYIEMAEASGLHLLKEEERDCTLTSSLGTGQLIADALHRGAREINLLVGGSATNDAGLGILNALGIRALDGDRMLEPIGGNLGKLTGFRQQGNAWDNIRFQVICDVKNPLFGPQGAAYVYGPQKGADAAAVALLDQGLRHFAEVVLQQHGRRVDQFEGAGAAGGVAAGISAFFPTTIQSGIEAMIDITGLAQAVSEAELVITGEGKFDHQTLEGKVVMGVSQLCQKFGKTMAVICGTTELTPGEWKSLNIWQVSALVDKDTTLEYALNHAYQLVCQRARALLG